MQNYDLSACPGPAAAEPVLLKRGLPPVQDCFSSAKVHSPAATKTSFSASGGIPHLQRRHPRRLGSPPFPCSTS